MLLILLQEAFVNLKRNAPLRLAAATAFFATFALPAILIILIQFLGLIFSRHMIGSHLLEHLSNILGAGTVNQLRKTLINVRHLVTNWYVAIGGFLFLIFVSTTLFSVIRDSLNELWNIQVVERHGIVELLKQRAKSLVIILLAGLLFLFVLSAETLQALLSGYFIELWGRSNTVIESIINQLISLTVVSTWFSVLFRFLPDGHPDWRVAFTGGLFTGILFTAGKLLLRLLLSYSNIQTIYGASASMALLLLFVFYSSFIFYYGACFTNVWAKHVKRPIRSRK
jgi:membrane protein